MTRAILILAAILGFMGLARADGVVVPAEQRYWSYSGNLPNCDDSGVLSTVTSRFGQKESWFWHSTLQVTSYDRIKEISFRGNGVAYIPRRYCIARAYLNDGEEHTAIYQIMENQGILGFSWGVESCLVGLDRNSAYSPACSALRPYAERFLGEKVLVEKY